MRIQTDTMGRIVLLWASLSLSCAFTHNADGFTMLQRHQSIGKQRPHIPLFSVRPEPRRMMALNETEAFLIQTKTPLRQPATIPFRRNQDRIVFGTAALGMADNPFELLDAAYQKGLRRFDLARTYGGGVSERIFGAWMKDRNIRRDLIDIITKGGMGEDKYGNPDRPMLTKKAFYEEVRDSLEALRTDYVDMYMFHRDDLRMDVEQFVLWGDELVRRGIAKRWGVSNWSFDRFRQAYDFAIENGLQPPRANSPQFSLAIPRCEVWPTTQSISGPEYAEQIGWYEKHHIELLCWEVLAKGFMAKPHLWSEALVDPSSFDAPVEIGTNEWRLQRIQRAYCYDMNYRRRRVAVQLASQLGYELSQIAILYILSMGNNIHVIFGSNNLDHLESVVTLGDCHLDEATKFRLSSVATSPYHP